jgi:hypothetical protein
MVTVVLTALENNLVELRDVTGRLIEGKLNMNGLVQFDLTNQSGGVYFVTVKSEKGNVTKKVIRL